MFKEVVLYQTVCVPCALKGISSLYIGESHRTWADRQNDHQNALEKEMDTYATVRHSHEMHPGASPLFTFHLIGNYKTSIERQIRESLAIENTKCDNILNGKGEWGMNIVPRAIFEPAKDVLNQPKLNRKCTNPKTNAAKLDKDSDSDSDNFAQQFSQRKRKRKMQRDQEQNATPTGNTDLKPKNVASEFSSAQGQTILPAPSRVMSKSIGNLNDIMRKEISLKHKIRYTQQKIGMDGRLTSHNLKVKHTTSESAIS